MRHYISPSVTQLLGYQQEELIGKYAVDITHPDDVANLRTTLTDVLNGTKEIGIVEIRQRHKNGVWVWMEASIRLTYSEEKKQPNGYISSVRNIVQRKSFEEKLTRLANRDPLTGLYNRNYFNNKLEDALTSHTENPQDIILFYMDIDGFKPVNDTYGHLAGDDIIKQVAERFQPPIEWSWITRSNWWG